MRRRLSKNIEEFDRCLRYTVQQSKIWNNQALANEINKRLTVQKKISTHQLGYLLRVQKSFVVFRKHDGIYCFVKRGDYDLVQEKEKFEIKRMQDKNKRRLRTSVSA